MRKIMTGGLAAAMLVLVSVTTGCDAPAEPVTPSVSKDAPSFSEPSEKDHKRGEEFSKWVEDFASHDEFDHSQLDTAAHDMREDAKEYPVKKNTAVPKNLRAAARHLARADRQLESKSWSGAVRHIRQARKRLTAVGYEVHQDLRILESRTGVRINETSGLDARDGTVTGHVVSPVKAKVGKWIDGDTVELSDGRRVRLIGIDTPEMSDQCSKAQAAKDLAESLAPAGSTILLRAPYSVQGKDKYGRLLRYVDIKRGDDVGYSLLLAHLAKARYDSRDGYQWHPREQSYRKVSTDPDRKMICRWSDGDDGHLRAHDDDDEKSRSHLLRSLDKKTKAKPLGRALHDAKVSAREARGSDFWDDPQYDWDRPSSGGGCDPGGCDGSCPPGGC